MNARWGWGKKEPEPETPIPRSHTAYKQFEVVDSKRDAMNVWLSPSGQYAVISDSLSRVMCLDLHSNLILHMWKGYLRDNRFIVVIVMSSVYGHIHF